MNQLIVEVMEQSLAMLADCKLALKDPNLGIDDRLQTELAVNCLEEMCTEFMGRWPETKAILGDLVEGWSH